MRPRAALPPPLPLLPSLLLPLLAAAAGSIPAEESRPSAHAWQASPSVAELSNGRQETSRLTFCVPDVTLPRSCKGRMAAPAVPAGVDVESEVTFIVYTPKYEPDAKELKINDTQSFLESGYNIKEDTKIIVHGYYSSAKNFEHTVSAYLTAADHNIILMDWSSLSKWCYCEHVLKIIEKLGRHLGRLLDFLVEKGSDRRRIHIVGHSLGCHIAGIGSLTSQRGRVGRITALDPARPGFSDALNPDRLHRDRADFVDVIHTSAHTFGISDPLGHVDFYPNGGQAPQPGCTGVAADMCSHSRAHYLFTESITTDVGFRAIQCSGWSVFLNGSCNAANAPSTSMGERLNRTSKHGVYYLKTGASCPYYVVKNSSPKVVRIFNYVQGLILFVSTVVMHGVTCRIL